MQLWRLLRWRNSLTCIRLSKSNLCFVKLRKCWTKTFPLTSTSSHQIPKEAVNSSTRSSVATTEPLSKESCRKPDLTSGSSFKIHKWVTSTSVGHQSHARSTSSASLTTSSRWSTTSRGITRSQRRMSFSKMSKTTSMSGTSIHSTSCRLRSISKSLQTRMTEPWKSNWLHSNKYSTCWKSSKVCSTANKTGL